MYYPYTYSFPLINKMKLKFLTLLLLIALCLLSTFAKHDDPKEDAEKKEDDDDKAGRIIIDCVKKCKCENFTI